MRGSSKGFVTGLVALLLVIGLGACGGDDDSSSTSSEAASQAQTEDDGTSSSDEPGGSTPNEHSDSGGGSEQYRVAPGDNSIQDFGKEAGDSEREEAAAALHSYLDARAEGEWAVACTYMAKSVAQSLEKLAQHLKQIGDNSCGGALEKLTNPAAKKVAEEEAAEADVGSLRLEGDSAFVIYTGAEGKVRAMPMTTEGGAWKVSSLTPTSLS